MAFNSKVVATFLFLRYIFNPLDFRRFFDNITADAGLILALLAAAVIAIILNTLVRFPWENKAHSIAKNS